MKLLNIQASGVGQMSLSVGDKVIVTNKEKEEWWYVWKDSKQVRSTTIPRRDGEKVKRKPRDGSLM